VHRRAASCTLLLGATFSNVRAVVAPSAERCDDDGDPGYRPFVLVISRKAGAFATADAKAAFTMYQPDGSFVMRGFYPRCNHR